MRPNFVRRAREALLRHAPGGADDECWLWTGAITSDGYGKCRPESDSWLAHRVAWTVARGEIPEGLCVCHKCDVRACCNPSHLFLGTNTDNVMDRCAKGRSARNTKTRCSRGHELVEGNLHWSTDASSISGRSRTCLTCRRANQHKYQREYYVANREVRAAKAHERYLANRESRLVRQREYYAANREVRAVKDREYYAKNRERLVAQAREYRAKKKAANIK